MVGAQASDYQQIGLYKPDGQLLNGAVDFDSGSLAQITVKYESSSAATTGVGFRVKFDQGACVENGVTVTTMQDNFAAGTLSEDGTSLLFAWASLFGAFPGATEADLATITFKSIFGDCQPYIEFTSSAANYDEINLNMEPLAPLVVNAVNVAGNSGANQVIATVTGGTDGVTYSLTSDSSEVEPYSQISIPEEAANTQHVYVSEATFSEDDTQLTVTLSYKCADPATTGVGFTLEFDSSELSLNEVSDVGPGAIVSGNLNGAGNELSFGFASLFGSFPGATEEDLATITFDIAGDVSGSSDLTIASTSVAAGYTFDGQDQEINFGSSELSIDTSTGKVTLDSNPVAQTEYTFEIKDSDGRTSGERSVQITANLAPLDVALIQLVENSGANQVIATVTDGTDGVTYSLTSDSSEVERQEPDITPPEQQSSTQHVYVSEATFSEDGTQLTVKVSYMCDNAATTGVGFTLEFDKNALSFNEVSDVAQDAVASGNLNDAGNMLFFGFASLFGSFPGSENADLATITFDITTGVSGTSDLSIVKMSNAVGFAFDGKPQEINFGAPSELSIDANTGEVTLTTNPVAQTEYTFEIKDSDGHMSGERSVQITAAILGCTYATACNYNEDATVNDVSCTYADEGYDCDGNCLDDDNDNVCNTDEVPGCTTATACNHNPLATDDNGSCTYADEYKDCAGNCLNDDDGDLVCDENEEAGCMDKRANDYNPLATDAGTCDMPGGTAAEQKRKRGKNFAKSQLSKVNDMLGESATADSIMSDLVTLVQSAGAGSKPNFGSIMNKLNRRGDEDVSLTLDDKKARASLLRAGMAETKEAGKDAMIVPVANDKLLPKRFKAKLEAANIANLELKYGKQRSESDVLAIESSTSVTEMCGDTNADIRLDLLSEAVEVILETQDSVSLKCLDAETPVSILKLVDDPDATDDLLNYKYKCWEGSAWGAEQSVVQYQSFECNGIETFVLSDTGTPTEEGYNCDSKEQYWLEQGCACKSGGTANADQPIGSADWCKFLKEEWQTNCGAAQCSA